MTSRPRVLFVDDDYDQCHLLQAMLERCGCVATSTTSPTEAIERAGDDAIDVVITDLAMDEMDGLTLCDRIIGTRPGLPVIVLTGAGTMESAIAAIHAGAYDYLIKPVSAELLQHSVTRAVEHASLRAEVKRLTIAPVAPPRLRDLVGASPAMRRIKELIVRVAASDASVLIQGETGTGKELVARAVHEASDRRRGPFIALNCAAVPSELLESELFGHERGAFTDAKGARPGLFVEASKGTMFLDEIGEMSVDMQAKLLRALQEKKVRPVGSDQERPFDARIITATHRDLEEEIEHERFRRDLFYRINVVRIDVPALRERKTDILTLAEHFLQLAAQRNGRAVVPRLTAPVADRLSAYDWPGNVRELENCIERAVALATGEELTVHDLPDRIRTYRPEHFVISADSVEDVLPVDEMHRRYIDRTIKLLGGNKARAAQLLGIDRRTLYRRLERYELNRQRVTA